MNKMKTFFKVTLVSIALLFLLVSSTALAVTEKNASDHYMKNIESSKNNSFFKGQ